MSGSTGLVEFLLQCIGQDEDAAREAAERNGGVWTVESLGEWDDSDNCRINGTVEPSNPRAYSGDRQLWEDEGALGMFGATAKHIASHDPDRVLRECKAKRDVVRMYQFQESQEHEHNAIAAMGLRQALRAIAAVYADRPGYDARWVDG